MAAVLGVERSLSGRFWRARGGDDRAGLALAQRFGLPEIVGRLLAGRGVAAEDAERFLAPTLRDFMPDPSHLKDMDRAVERLVRAIREAEPVVVFGDYDVDGATSSALLLRFFAAVGGRGDGLYPRPPARRLWPQRAGAGEAEGRGRARRRHRRLRHHGA